MLRRFLFFYLVAFLLQITLESEDLLQKRLKHEAVEIPDYKLSTIARMSDMDHMRRTLDKILVPRVVGTLGHDNVRDFIIKSMKDLKWTVEVDDFIDKAPSMGDMKFENIITTLNPNAERFLVLACHYDSKYFKDEEFLGATDSAVPCAMLINLAYVMNEVLEKVSLKEDLSLKFVFFDGEEAFVDWGPQDSIYGARHLAEKWEQTNFLPQIDMILLLDLLGAPDPNFYNFFKSTEKWYAQLMGIEERLATGAYLSSYTTNGVAKIMPNRYFQAHTVNSYVEDDHIPFLQRGVPILHLIPIPFPNVWHTKDDNYEAIDFKTIENLNRILRVFVAEYLQLEM